MASLVGLALVLVFIGALFLAVVTRQNPAGAPSALGQRAFIVLSGSMTGTFDAGDLALDRTVTLRQAEQLHRGQIISFEETLPGGAVAGVITHRIYRVGRVLNAKTQHYTTYYETKGDANPVADGNRILPQQVLGVYEMRIPDAGYVLQDLHQPLVFILLISVPFAVLVVLEARRRWKAT
ncbi:MAG TPA: signal peptidase I [Candidatus Dormibacteraeota bacterium]